MARLNDRGRRGSRWITGRSGRTGYRVCDVAIALAQNLRQALRGLWRSPGYAAVAVLTLALGIGANTAVFSVVNGLLLRPLPFHRFDELVVLVLTNPAKNVEQGPVGYADYLRWRDQAEVFRHMGLFLDWGFNLTGGDRPERVRAAAVSHGFFEVLAAPPLLGRWFLPEEHERGQGRVAVLSRGVWERRFGADPEIIGSTVYLDGESYQVVGVVPPEAQWPREAEIWIPLTFGAVTPDWVLEFDALGYSVIARLQRGVDVSRAAAVVDAIAQRAAADRPDTRAGFGATAVSLRSYVVGDNTRRALWLLMGCVGFVLLIACANVANLTLERSLARQQEIAIRAAIGAGRVRSVQPLAWECLAVALMGGAVGMGASVWVTEALAAMAPSTIPGIHELGVDLRVLTFTAAVSLVTGLVFTLAPAVTAARLDLLRCLKEGGPRSGGQPTGGRTRRTMTVVQLAMSVVWVLGASLIVKSTVRLLRTDPGFQLEGLLTMKVFLPHYAPGSPEDQRIGPTFQEFAERLGALPGAASASAVSALPLSADGLFDNLPFAVDGREDPLDRTGHFANWNIVGVQFFETMGIPLIRGRAFFRNDAPTGGQVAILSESLAREMFFDQDPIGRKIRPLSDVVTDTVLEVVGVVGDVRYMDLADAYRNVVYVPQAQSAWRAMAMVVRFEGAPAGRVAEVRDAIWAVDPTVPITEVRTMEQVASRSLAAPRFATVLVASFALLALTLAVVGLFGVISYSLRQRYHELAVRKALGAEGTDLGRLLIGEGARLAVIAIAMGLPAGVALTRLPSGLLYEVSASDPLVLAAVPALLALVAVSAALVPARRAARVDPMVALRQH